MAEETLANKIITATTNAGYSFTTAQLDSLTADAIRFLSQYLPKLTKNSTWISGDGSTTEFDFDATFIDLWKNEKKTFTGIQLYPTSEGVSSAYDVDSCDFMITYGATPSIEFENAPESTETGLVWYKGVWSTTGSDLPLIYQRAVVLLATYYALTQSRAYGGSVTDEREGSVSVSYRENQSTGNYYLDLAMTEINSLMSSPNASLTYGLIHARRG